MCLPETEEWGTHRDFNLNAEVKNQLFLQSWAHERVWKIKGNVKYYFNTKAIHIPQKINLSIYKSLTRSDEIWSRKWNQKLFLIYWSLQ